MSSIAELKKRLMRDPSFKAEYEKANAEFALLEARIRAQMQASDTRRS